MHMHCLGNGMIAWGRCYGFRSLTAACGLTTFRSGMQAGTQQGLAQVRQPLMPTVSELRAIQTSSIQQLGVVAAVDLKLVGCVMQVPSLGKARSLMQSWHC